jgi:hypothetical protein
MVHTTVDGTFRQTNLTNESPEYLAKREELRLAEIELMRQRTCTLASYYPRVAYSRVSPHRASVNRRAVERLANQRS